MKRTKILLTILLALLVSGMMSLVAFADYPDMDVDAISGHTIGEDGSVAFTISDEMLNTIPDSKRIAIFSADPELVANDTDGFWVVYGKAGKANPEKLALQIAINKTAAVTTTFTTDDVAWEEGHTYYVGVAGLDLSQNPDWRYSSRLYSFTYTTQNEEPTEEPTEAPTEEPTEAPTENSGTGENQSGNNQGGNGEQQNTADVSALLWMLPAIAGTAVLFGRKKASK